MGVKKNLEEELAVLDVLDGFRCSRVEAGAVRACVTTVVSGQVRANAAEWNAAE